MKFKVKVANSFFVDQVEAVDYIHAAIRAAKEYNGGEYLPEVLATVWGGDLPNGARKGVWVTLGSPPCPEGECEWGEYEGWDEHYQCSSCGALEVRRGNATDFEDYRKVAI